MQAFELEHLVLIGGVVVVNELPRYMVSWYSARLNRQTSVIVGRRGRAWYIKV